MDNNWFEQHFINEVKPALDRHSGAGAGSAPSAKLNIAYGTTPPSNTSKLWVKTSKAEGVHLSSLIDLQIARKLGTTLPVATAMMQTAVIGTKIYLLGGYTSSYTDYTPAIYCFDTETRTITTLSITLPTGKHSMGSAVIGTKVYLLGGNPSTEYTKIYCFDTEASIITTLGATLPYSMYSMCYGLVGTKVYLLGGIKGGQATNAVCSFDTDTETVTTLGSPLPDTVYDAGSATIGTKIYVFGGANNTNPSGFYEVRVFDTDTLSVTKSSGILPYKFRSFRCAVHGNKVYLFGGYKDTETYYVYCFDAETFTITLLPTGLSKNLRYVAVGTVGTTAYVFGGIDSSSNVSNTIYSFDMGVDLPKKHLAIMTDIATNQVELAPGLPVGVTSVYKGNSDNIGEPVEAYLYKDGAWTLI